MALSQSASDRTQLFPSAALVTVAGCLGAACLLGLLAGSGALGSKELISLVVGLAVLGYLLNGTDASHWALLCAGIASIAVGYRSIHVGYWSYLVPLEIIVWLLWGWLMLVGVARHERSEVRIPRSLAIVTAWAVLRAAATVIAGGDWDAALAWTAPLVVGFPTFYVVGRLIKREQQVQQVLIIVLLVSAVISALGLVEYYVPSVDRIFPWFFTTQVLVAQGGFVRAAFGFWGFPNVAAMITWGMLIAYQGIVASVGTAPRRFAVKTVLAGIILLDAAAVYISGQRSAWLGVALALGVLSLPLGLRGWSGIGATLALSTLLPEDFWVRFATIFTSAATGVAADTSLQSRLDLWSRGYQTTRDNLAIGVGYGHSLVHNVFLEIGSTIGLLPALVFGVFVVSLIVRIGKMAFAGPTPASRTYGWLFLALAVTWVVQILIETVFQTPPFAVAHWAVMAVAWYLPEILAGEKISQSSEIASTPR